MSTYVLPELDYDYSALEPHLSARIVDLHHSKHHQAYVDALKGYVGSAARTCGCVGPSGGTGGTRSNQDYRK